MKWRIRWHAEWCTTILIALLIVVGPFRSQAWAQAEHVRWDLVTITITNGTVAPGGTASAQAQDGSTIFMTGSGTFVAPSKNGNSFGSNGSAKGGGTWTITGPNASPGTISRRSSPTMRSTKVNPAQGSPCSESSTPTVSAGSSS
jgi:hypothetical protein